MNFRLFSKFRLTRQLSTFAAAALIVATMLLVFAPSGSSQPSPRPPAWSVQSTDPAHSLLTLKGSVMVGIDSGMFWVVQVRIEGSGGGQLASFQPNMAVVLESPGSKPLAAPAVETTIGGKAQPQPGVVAKSRPASTVFTGIPTSGQTLLIQAAGVSAVEGVVASVTGPQTYTVGSPGSPGPPCCAVTAFNSQTGIATAKVNTKGQIFMFQAPLAPPREGPPPGPGQPASYLHINVGQPVWANLITGEVSLDGKIMCCRITAEGMSSSGSTGKPAAQEVKNPILTNQACCEITGLNQRANTASAKVKSNGQTFQIAITNPAQFQSLRVGQPIWANFTTGAVSLDGRTACCAITSKENVDRGPGWIRYGTVANAFSGGVRLIPVASVLGSRAPANVSTSQLGPASTDRGGIGFPVPVKPVGQIKGTTEVKTTEALRGFEGRLVVFLLDENGQPVFQTSEGPWGVNGTAIPGAPSDRTVDWAEPVPADAMALARKIVILHSYAPVDKWQNTLIQGATDLGYVILGIACVLMGNEVVIGTDGFSCQPPSGGDSTGSSQAVATGASMIFSRPVPLQSPHSGQMVWVNLQAKQALWTAFPITAHQQDDLGNSHYMDTSVTVFYPPVAQPGTSLGAAGGGGLEGRPVVLTPGACCAIISIDARARLAAARVNSTGQNFEFSVPNSVPVQNLHAGQPVWANLKARQVSLDGRTACCEIVAEPSAQPTGLAKMADTNPGKSPAASGSGLRPGFVELGALWEPLGRVASVGPNQLSIRTIVPTQERSGGGARERSRAPAAGTAPQEGPVVMVGVEMASEPTPKQSGSMAVREASPNGGARTQNQAGQNTATPGTVMARESGIMLKPVPPLPGQMVWVNRTMRQIRWVNFPFSMTQEDDLGDSHHLKTEINVSLPSAGGQGLIKGETRLWTFREIGGFNGRVWVTFADDMNRPLFIASRPRPNVPGEGDSWHVCGHSEFWCGASDVTRDWGESVPADDLLRAAKVSIRQGAEDTLGADLLKAFCDVFPCSVGNCSHPPSVQNPPSPQNPDPCGPPSGAPPGSGGGAPPRGNAASTADSPDAPLLGGPTNTPPAAPACCTITAVHVPTRTAEAGVNGTPSASFTFSVPDSIAIQTGTIHVTAQ